VSPFGPVLLISFTKGKVFPMAITVLLADKAEVVRDAIRSLLFSNSQIVELVGESADFPQTVQMANHLKPQVLVMDFYIARATEVAAVKGFLQEHKVLAISLSNDDETKELAEQCDAVLFLVFSPEFFGH
jgi:DNA-binding NarL/FixJ family response regulator